MCVKRKMKLTSLLCAGVSGNGCEVKVFFVFFVFVFFVFLFSFLSWGHVGLHEGTAVGVLRDRAT